jgi:hypothetical protein
MSTMQKNPPKSSRSDDIPDRTWVATIADLGAPGLGLRTPLIVTLEDFGDEIVASYHEVEAFGSGPTEADAINSLKDAIADLYTELAAVPDQELGKLPKRWKRTLCAVAHPTGV